MDHSDVLAGRQAMLNAVKTAPPHKALRMCIDGGRDWGMLTTLAEREDLSPRIFEELVWHGTWPIHMVLCSNPAFPKRLLRRLAEVPNGKPPAANFDLSLEAHDIVRVARSALRRRLNMQ